MVAGKGFGNQAEPKLTPGTLAWALVTRMKDVHAAPVIAVWKCLLETVPVGSSE